MLGHIEPVDVGVVELTFEIGLDVVMVKERTACHCMARMSDRETVFNHVLTIGYVAEGEFMSGRDVTD